MPSVVKQTLKKSVKKPSGGVLDRLQSGWDLVDTMSLLLYGKSGTGKTTLWATFPGPILAIIVSGGKKPGEMRSVNTAEYRDKITPVIIQESSDIRELMEHADQFKTVVLDHASGLQDLVLKEILGIDELPVQKSWGLATMQQYGQCTMQCKEILRAFLGLSCNRVIIAQERTFGGSDEGSDSEVIAPSIGAAMTPSLVGWLNPACDYVCETFIRQKTKVMRIGDKEKIVKAKGVDYCLRTAPDPIYTVKFRKPRGKELPDCLVDPSYEKILALTK
jgi:DNA polymerase III delta prime subunit